jgi:glutaredoxin
VDTELSWASSTTSDINNVETFRAVSTKVGTPMGPHRGPFLFGEIMNFAVYSRNGCPYCTKVKQVLSAKGYTYTEYRLGDSFTREDFYKQFGQGSTFPQVLLDSKHLGGCTETVRYLKENNLI